MAAGDDFLIKSEPRKATTVGLPFDLDRTKPLRPSPLPKRELSMNVELIESKSLHMLFVIFSKGRSLSSSP